MSENKKAIGDIYNEIVRHELQYISPRILMSTYNISRYTARKIIKMFRNRGVVEYKIIIDGGCNGNCTNEAMSYCECGPPSPPMGVREIIKK